MLSLHERQGFLSEFLFASTAVFVLLDTPSVIRGRERGYLSSVISLIEELYLRCTRTGVVLGRCMSLDQSR